LGYILGELFRNSSGHTATNGPKMTLIKAAISIGLAYRKVNINNKNVTGSQKMRFTNKGWDLPRYVSDRWLDWEHFCLWLIVFFREIFLKNTKVVQNFGYFCTYINIYLTNSSGHSGRPVTSSRYLHRHCKKNLCHEMYKISMKASLLFWFCTPDLYL
jgi:hypothetical protein